MAENDEQLDDEQVEIEMEGGDRASLSGYDTKLALAMRVISNMREQLENLEAMLSGEAGSADLQMARPPRFATTDEAMGGFGGRVIDGVFDGEQMVGEDGRKYLVPPNYASKSKLVEGDLMRLNISDNGKFIFKQKGPIERERLMGALIQDELSSDWKVIADNRVFRVLAAAVSFHRGAVGDDAVILVPKGAPSRWAALENVVKKTDEDWNI